MIHSVEIWVLCACIIALAFAVVVPRACDPRTVGPCARPGIRPRVKRLHVGAVVLLVATQAVIGYTLIMLAADMRHLMTRRPPD